MARSGTRTFVTRVCDRCGSEFQMPASDVGRRPGRFCSLRCRPQSARLTVDQFIDRVDQSRGFEACWPWRGSRLPTGYGRVSGTTLAHRRAYELFVGDLIDGLEVMHLCDNPPCCNPSHLTLGSHRDNLRDASRKGRWRNQHERSVERCR